MGITYLLEQYLDKLPKTQLLINASIESLEAYQIRRVRTIANRMEYNNETLTKTKLCRIVGLKTSCSEAIKNEITRILNRN